MHAKIKNRDALLSYGCLQSRAAVLDIAERTLEELDSYHRIRSILHLEGSILRIGARCWDLDQKEHVYLIGAGKACNAMAMAVESVLQDRLTDGIIIVKILEPEDRFIHTRVRIGGHPIPNEAGYQACMEILDLIDHAGPNDLFLCVMSGGSSALMSCPIEGISLSDEQSTTDVLLKSGAGILEINAVRRHISRMNGGQMAKRIMEKGAELIGFNISDSISNPPTSDISIPWSNYFGTPMGPDQTTLQDALNCVKKYALWDRLPPSVTHYLTTCGPDGETPKSFPRNTYYQINTLPDSVEAAKRACDRLGIPSIILSTFIEGEAKDMGTLMASLAREIQTYQRPFSPPCAILSAGESVTTIPDNCVISGHGGPSQEMTLSFAISASKTKGACLLSIDTEGTDGTTNYAGGITDSDSLSQIRSANIDIYSALRGHASSEALVAGRCAIMTGNTGTNLCDLNILYVPELDHGNEEKGLQ